MARASRCDERDQDGHDLLQAIIAPKHYFICKENKMNVRRLWRMILEGRLYGPPSSTFILLVSVWTTQSSVGSIEPSSRLSEPRNCSTKGDKRKERYGVISDCVTRNAGKRLFTGDLNSMRYLEIIQKPHIGIAKRSFPFCT